LDYQETRLIIQANYAQQAVLISWFFGSQPDISQSCRITTRGHCIVWCACLPPS